MRYMYYERMIQGKCEIFLCIPYITRERYKESAKYSDVNIVGRRWKVRDIPTYSMYYKKMVNLKKEIWYSKHH